jgi:hypothetical protein
MKQQRTKAIFKVLFVLLCLVLAIYAGLFLGYQQLLQESNVYAEHLVSGTRIAAVATLAP